MCSLKRGRADSTERDSEDRGMPRLPGGLVSRLKARSLPVNTGRKTPGKKISADEAVALAA